MAVQKIFRTIGDPVKLEVKLAPQEQVVFNAIPEGKGIERADLVSKLEKQAEEGTLKTGQKPASILGYYTKHLVDSKLIEVEKIVTEPEVKQDEKPAAKSKAKPTAKSDAAA